MSRNYLLRPLGAMIALAVLVLGLGILATGGAQAGGSEDSATMSLVAKPNAAIEVLVKDTFTVSVHMDQISMIDRDGDNKGGYTGWQTRINFSDGLKLEGDPVFTWPDADPATTAFVLGTGTVLLGSTIGVDVNGDLNQESTFLGNLVDLKFTCNEPNKTYKITLKTSTDTFVLAEPDPGPPPVSKTADAKFGVYTLNVNCKAASMSLSLKEGSHFQNPDTGVYHIKVDTKFTVNVNVDAIRNLVDKDENGGGYTAVKATVSFDTELVLQSSTVVAPGCTGAVVGALTSAHIVECTAFDDAQSDESTFEGKVFQLVFKCDSLGTDTLQLFPANDTKILDENFQPVNMAVSNLSVRCVGGAEDKDEDGCSHDQELANGTDTNKYDFWDTNKNGVIDVQDFLNYLLKFGQAPDAGPPSANKVNDTNADGVINIIDIINVVNQFGKSCP